MELTIIQARYVRGYMRHRDARRAAREAGLPWDQYDAPEIVEAIRMADEAAFERYKATPEKITGELAKVGFFNLGKLMVEGRDGHLYPDFAHLDAGDAAAISEMTVETYMDGPPDIAREVKKVRVKFHPKIQALQLLGNSMRMWQDRHEHTVGEDIVERIRAAREAVSNRK